MGIEGGAWCSFALSGTSAIGARFSPATKVALISAAAAASPALIAFKRSSSKRRIPARIAKSGTKPCSVQWMARFVAVLI